MPTACSRSGCTRARPSCWRPPERLREIERRELLHEERQRLMQDMHDGMGSSLVGALRAAEQGRIGAPTSPTCCATASTTSS